MTNEEQTPEDKLREAAEMIEYDHRLTPIQTRALLKFAKSEAARDYHMAQKPKVVSYIKLRSDFSDDVWAGTKTSDQLFTDHILPHLQPESDAVKFAEWATQTGWTFRKGEWRQSNSDIRTNSEYVYKLFNEFKSDGKDDSAN